MSDNLPAWAMEIRDMLKRNRDDTMATNHLCREIEKIAARALVAERGLCAKIADAEFARMESTAMKHPPDSERRDRCFARARTAMTIAAAIRNQEPINPA